MNWNMLKQYLKTGVLVLAKNKGEMSMGNKDTYTKEEVIEMLKEMQKEAAKCQGFVVGHVTQLWVIEDMLGKRIKDMGGEGIQVIIK